MSFRNLILAAIAVFFCMACCEDLVAPFGPLDCERIDNSKILSEEDKEEACMYNDVFRFQSEIYTVCECCICNKVAMALDCEENPLCDLSEECMGDFYQNAVYLFSIE